MWSGRYRKPHARTHARTHTPKPTHRLPCCDLTSQWKPWTSISYYLHNYNRWLRGFCSILDSDRSLAAVWLGPDRTVAYGLFVSVEADVCTAVPAGVGTRWKGRVIPMVTTQGGCRRTRPRTYKGWTPDWSMAPPFIPMGSAQRRRATPRTE